MASKVKPIPDGYNTVIPYLIVKGADSAMEFYQKAFRAENTAVCVRQPDGRVGHAEIQIGDTKVMLADEFPEMGHKGPKALGGCPISLHLYVEDVDATVERAVAAGAKVIRPVANQFYGDRTGGVEDPFGYTWYVATHVEDLSMEEIARRAAEMHNKK